jgi:hypothetical protein
MAETRSHRVKSVAHQKAWQEEILLNLSEHTEDRLSGDPSLAARGLDHTAS